MAFSRCRSYRDPRPGGRHVIDHGPDAGVSPVAARWPGPWSVWEWAYPTSAPAPIMTAHSPEATAARLIQPGRVQALGSMAYRPGSMWILVPDPALIRPASASAAWLRPTVTSTRPDGSTRPSA